MPTLSDRLHVVTLIDLVAEAGGAEVLAADLVERVDPAAFRRTLVVYRRLDPAGPLHASQARVIGHLEAAGVEVLQLDGRDRRDLAAWRPFVRLMRSGTVDVLHSHKHGPNAWGAMFARLDPSVAFVPHEHTWSFEGHPVRKLIDRWLIATRSDAFLAVSDRDRRRMVELEHIPEERIVLLENGVPAPDASSAPDLRELFGIPHDAPLIGAVGLYRAQKDFPTLLRAHAILRKRWPEAHLVLIGDGEERPRLEALRGELGLARNVTFTGYRDDAPALAAGLDVAVNSSTFEGASLAILECMALGRPMVATAVGGTPELLDGGRAGVLVEPGDPEGLASAIGGILADDARAADLGARARARQHERYSIEAQVRRLEELYRDVARRRR